MDEFHVQKPTVEKDENPFYTQKRSGAAGYIYSKQASRAPLPRSVA